MDRVIARVKILASTSVAIAKTHGYIIERLGTIVRDGIAYSSSGGVASAGVPLINRLYLSTPYITLRVTDDMRHVLVKGGMLNRGGMTDSYRGSLTSKAVGTKKIRCVVCAVCELFGDGQCGSDFTDFASDDEESRTRFQDILSWRHATVAYIRSRDW